MINMFKRNESQESFQIRHPKTNKYHKNNHYGQVHSERHQYDYYFTLNTMTLIRES
jgi:hypothetical protein